MHILHINDNNILIQAESSTATSQGYAWLKGDSVVFDCSDAPSPVQNCRLAPQEINSRYWQQCEQSSIPTNGAGMRHAADLIWKHLSELKTVHQLNEVVLVVPSHYQSNNLRLLLGIAKACDLKVVGLLNKSVLAVSSLEVQSGRYLHVDVQLHQTVTSEVNLQAGLAKLGAVEVVQGVGIHAMQDALLKGLQSQFILNDRFDPLHYADTEQQLFDQLIDAAAQITANGKASVAVQQQQQLHSTSIDKKSWSKSLAPLLKPLSILGQDYDHVYLDMNAAFGVHAPHDLEGPDLSLVTQIPSFAKAGVAHPNADNGNVTYITELAIEDGGTNGKSPQRGDESQPETSSSAVIAGPTGATHLMQAGIAVPIEHSEVVTDNNELVLHTSAQGNAEALLSAGKLFVMNDESRKTLKPNDRLGSHLGEGVITVIQVV